MTWNLVKVETKKITPKLATEFMEMTATPNERNLSEKRLQVYEKLVREGQWRPCVWAKGICAETGETYRVNGQHTATLFSTLANEFTDLHVVIETYDTPELADVSRLYSTFDSKMNSRTTSDINKAFAASIPELASMPRKIIDSAVAGISFHLAGAQRSTMHINQTPQERAENLLTFPEFVSWLYELIFDTNKYRYLCRQGIVAAMFATYQKAKTKSDEFWKTVRDETGAKPSCPDRMLSRWLLTTSSRSDSNNDTPKSRKADAREFYGRCLICWNAWRRGDEMKIIKYQSTGKMPAIL